MSIDGGVATVIAATVSAAAAMAAAAISGLAARRARNADRHADQARRFANSAAESVAPNGRGTVMDLLAQVDSKVDVLAREKTADNRALHARINAVVALLAHYLGTPPPGLHVPPEPAPHQEGA